MMEIVVLGKENCSKCTYAKEKLEELGVTYKWSDTDTVNGLAEYMYRADRFKGALPIVCVDGECFNVITKALERIRDGERTGE